MRTVVVDASVVAKWVLDEPGSELALALAREWAVDGVRVVAPTLLWSEVANVLHRRVAAGQVRADRAESALEALVESALTTRSERPLAPRAFRLAQELQLPSVYDAVYLAVAEAEQAEFWTFDARLHWAASKAVPWVRLAGGSNASSTTPK